MSKYYYHNITKGIFNENCITDAVENSDKNDLIKFSVRGCAIMYDIRTLEEDDFNEYEYIKEEFFKLQSKFLSS